MQLFVRGLNGRSVPLTARAVETVAELTSAVEALEGVPPNDGRGLLVLTSGRRQLTDGSRTLASYGVNDGATVHVSARLLGGKPVKVKILTEHLPCGGEVVIDVEKGTPMAEVRRKLAAATGVPPQHQKIMLSGIDQLVMGDKRTNVGFAHCGTASSLYFVAATAAESAAGK